MINGNFVNQNQWLQNNNSFSNSFSSFTDASSFSSLGNGTFTNSPTVQTFGNIAPGRSQGEARGKGDGVSGGRSHEVLSGPSFRAEPPVPQGRIVGSV